MILSLTCTCGNEVEFNKEQKFHSELSDYEFGHHEIHLSFDSEIGGIDEKGEEDFTESDLYVKGEQMVITCNRCNSSLTIKKS
ncbi:hypothetical protein [Bacillus altitudinis]|uniref:hypothetical protein n=1 Tax=Bacillus altitudinis TaxID=293387 RepID=UPI0037CC48FA